VEQINNTWEKFERVSPNIEQSLNIKRYESVQTKPYFQLGDYKIKRLDSLDEIDEKLWDSLLDKGDLFNCHRFLRGVEKANIEKAKHWYFLFEYKGELVGSAMMCSFVIHLDSLVEGGLKTGIQSVRKVFKNFLKLEFLFCGAPVSLGQQNLALTDPLHDKAIAELLTKSMNKLAAEQGIKYMMVKEFREPEALRIDSIENDGFYRYRSVPYMEMSVPWHSFDEFSASLRTSYRRKMQKCLKKLGGVKPQLIHWQEEQLPQEKGAYLLHPSLLTPELFYQLYISVMDRQEIKLETLNQAFFTETYQSLKDEISVMAIVDKGVVHCAALLAQTDKKMNFMLVGKADFKNDALDPYFNIVYCILDHAISQGCDQLKLGQTAYWVKQQIGAIGVEEYLYVKATNKWVNKVINLLGDELFPVTTLTKANVFKQVKGKV